MNYSELGTTCLGTDGLKAVDELIQGSPFRFIELGLSPLEGLLASPSLPRSVVSINDFISPMDARNLMEQKKSLRTAFFGEFDRKAGAFSKSGIRFVGMDFSIENCMDDMFNYNDLIDVFKKLASSLLPLGISICIPVRIPSVTMGANPSFYRKFLIDTMLPNCSLALEVFPHELMGKGELSEFLKPYRLDSAIIGIKYDLKAGNILVDRLIKPVMNALSSLPSQKPSFFDPMTNDFDSAVSEIKRLSKIMKNL
jgi:hypothetical protein